jgi:hypothetical protein
MIQFYSRYLEGRQIHDRWLDPRLLHVPIGAIEAYLVKKGWKPVTPDRPNVLVFQEPTVEEGGPLYQFVPDTEQRRDYVARLYELIAAIADVEKRYAGDVLTEILEHAAAGANGPATAAKAEPASR